MSRKITSRLWESRLHSGKFPDSRDAVVVNQKFARDFGWEAGARTDVTIDSVAYSIVGIVEDFHHDNFDA